MACISRFAKAILSSETELALVTIRFKKEIKNAKDSSTLKDNTIFQYRTILSEEMSGACHLRVLTGEISRKSLKNAILCYNK